MTDQLATVTTEALALPEQDRARLAKELLDSLDHSSSSQEAVDQAWDVEICRRINEIEYGRMELKDADDVMNSLKEQLNIK